MNTSTQPDIKSMEILFEDEYIVVINKPNNFIIHESHYSRNIREITLIQFLTNQLGYSVYPAHRLDRKTSGVIIFLKDKQYVQQFQELFTNKEITKTYFAIVRGFSPATGIIDTPVKNDDTGIYKEALTHYQSITNIELNIPVTPYAKSRYSLIQLNPQTGRMHQLRKHMSKINHPIVGDYKYGDRFHNRMFETEFDCIYMFLHAYRLEFTHPISLQKMDIKAAYPSDWQKVFHKFNWKKT